ncbi:glycogen synthase [Methylomusa anaerophila]|uniref:Glycogen synthase n=2 Tax=Methylomusa anaerophila TaxID=1930071 RepID=A0A348AHX0_9FIRM|nr:glycogen synthase [Methylomusa anaerophila]
MKPVLFLATESFPFVKSGGMGDVIGSLPRELRRQGVEARVILPKFSAIPPSLAQAMTPLSSFDVKLGWRKQPCRLWRLEYDGVIFYFVDNDYYFNRQGLYGWPDDAERFAYFCRAVLEALPHLDFAPHILHCHDWHTAILPLLLKAGYAGLASYSRLKTVLTIHNIEYQGCFDRSVLTDLLELDNTYYFTSDRLEFYGTVSYLKAGIVFADALTTVSPSYAWEITTPEGGRGLDGILRERQADLTGIVNGIDYDTYNPGGDPLIDTPYTWQSVQHKQQNKTKLQELSGLPVQPDIPLMSMVSRLVPAKGLDILLESLPVMMDYNAQWVIMSTGEERYETLLRAIAHQYPDRLYVQTYFDEGMAHRIYAGSDLYLQPSLSEPCGTSQLVAMRYGSVPLVRATGGLKDTVIPFNEATGAGTGFVFDSANSREFLAALRQAVILYHHRETWHSLVKNAMKSDHSWRRSVDGYLAVYRRLQS